ncbi:hypothetical protein ACIQEY_11880, partial [Streptomyces parvus]|uniref:hypothetical protein n=1 Tax=Streptomyces parvus TaxID=66428 RepID=UPI0037FB291B
MLERSDVTQWIASVGCGPDSDDELVYLLTEQDPGSVPTGKPKGVAVEHRSVVAMAEAMRRLLNDEELT